MIGVILAKRAIADGFGALNQDDLPRFMSAMGTPRQGPSQGSKCASRDGGKETLVRAGQSAMTKHASTG